MKLATFRSGGREKIGLLILMVQDDVPLEMRDDLIGLSARRLHDSIQVLFALNETDFVGDGNNLDFAAHFRLVPARLAGRVGLALCPPPAEDRFSRQRQTLVELIEDVLPLGAQPAQQQVEAGEQVRPEDLAERAGVGGGQVVAEPPRPAGLDLGRSETRRRPAAHVTPGRAGRGALRAGRRWWRDRCPGRATDRR